MVTIFETLFHPLSSAITTVLMIVSLIYWVLSFLGLGFDDLDLDIDVGIGIATDMQVDSETDLDTNNTDSSDQDINNDSLFISFLKYLNVGKVPFMVIFSILNFFMWIGSLATSALTTISNWGWKSVFILIPCFIIAVFLTKYATNPIARFLKKTGYHGEDRIDFLGRTGKMLSNIENTKIGNAEFIIEKDPIKLNVISHSGEKINYGDIVIITDESEDKKIFHVTNKNNYHPSKLKFKL